MSNANERKTGRQMLEEIAEAFSNISFAYMEDSRALDIALRRLRDVYHDMYRRFPDNPDWRKWNDYFTNHSGNFNKDRETLSTFMERFINGTVHETWVDKEWQRTSALISIRLQNIPYLIQQDAERAAEPFLSLLR